MKALCLIDLFVSCMLQVEKKFMSIITNGIKAKSELFVD
jgi:hypothetical protein